MIFKGKPIEERQSNLLCQSKHMNSFRQTSEEKV